MSPGTLQGAGDVMGSKTGMEPALVELRVQWENTGCNQTVRKGNASLQSVVCVIKGGK